MPCFKKDNKIFIVKLFASERKQVDKVGFYYIFQEVGERER